MVYLFSTPMELRAVLKHIGFQGKEVDIYMTALRLGMQPASVIAEKLGLNRVTTYSTLKKLVERGLAHTSMRSNMQYFAVETPQNLMKYVERKEEEWHMLRGKLRRALEEVDTQETAYLTPLRAATYHGIEGCKTLFSEALSAQKLVLVLSDQGKSDSYRSLWLEVFLASLERSMPPSTHIFATKTSLSAAQIERLEERGAEVYLLDNMPFAMDLMLCDDSKTAFIAENQGLFSGALLEHIGPKDAMHDFISRTLSSLAGGFNFLAKATT